jgi:hypothetical protein
MLHALGSALGNPETDADGGDQVKADNTEVDPAKLHRDVIRSSVGSGF